MSKKPSKSGSRNSKTQKEPWDDGFWKGKIPSYQSTLDPHCDNYLGESIKLQLSESKSHLKRSNLPESHSENLKKSSQKLPGLDQNRLKEELERTWALKSIPEPQRTIFRGLVYSLPKNKAMAVLTKEIEDLRQDKATVQFALRSVAAREEILKNIREMNEYLMKSEDWDQIEEVRKECAEMLHTLSMLTLNAVESIVSWKQQLSTYAFGNDKKSNSLPFVWEGINYLIKLQTDLEFLAISDFAKVFNFAPNHDPFMLNISKIITQKKKGSPYFSSKELVLIPIKANLLARIKQAERVIYDERNSAIDVQDEETRNLSPRSHCYKNILDEAILEISNDVARTVFHEEALKIDQMIFKNLSEEMVKEILFEICSQCAKETFAEESSPLIHKYLEDNLMQIINNLIDKEVPGIAKECIKDHKDNKKLKKNDPQVAKLVTNELIESCIADLNDLIHESRKDIEDELEIKQSYIDREKEMQNSLISKEITESLITELLGSNYLYDLSYDCIIEEEKSRPLTPDSVSIQSSRIAESIEDHNWNFGIGTDISETSVVNFKPLNVYESTIQSVLAEYYPLIPNPINEIVMPIDLLMSEAFIGTNTCWFWAMSQDSIIGLLVFSENTNFPDSHIITVLHMSCLSFSYYKHILQNAEKFIYEKEQCSSIRFELLNTNLADDIPWNIKMVFTSSKYKWKAKSFVKSHSAELIVYGKEKDHSQELLMDVSLKNVCYTVCSTEEETRPRVDKSLAFVGNRQSLLKNLLSLIGETEKNEINLPLDTHSRLQSDVSDSLAIINATDSFAFPFMTSLCTLNQQELLEFVKKYWADLKTYEGKQSATILDLSFKWVCCTHIEYQPLDKNYFYYRFRSPKMLYKAYEAAEIFVIPTSNPTLKAFFIVSPHILNELNSEINQFKTDIVYKTEALLNAAEIDVKEQIKELWVPVFQFEMACDNPWIPGFNLPAQRNEPIDWFVSKCQDQVHLNMKPKMPKEGLLTIPEPTGIVISNTFIFGLLEENTEKIIESPLFVALIQEKNWVKFVN